MTLKVVPCVMEDSLERFWSAHLMTVFFEGFLLLLEELVPEPLNSVCAIFTVFCESSDI